MTDNNSFDNLRTLHVATTPGEWGLEPSGLPLIDDEPRYVIVAGNADVASDVLGSHDAAFIVAAHNELPALLAERDALSAVIEEIRDLPHGEFGPWDDDLMDAAVVHKILSAAPPSILASHDAKVRAQALRDAAGATSYLSSPWGREGGDWLRARADKEENR